MAEVLLFHHALGRTPGVLAFANTLREAGHTIHVPDLYEGRTFADLNSGVDHAQRIGFETIIDRGIAAASDLPDEGLVYAGFSLGVLPAQKLAQTRPGAGGALLFSSCVPVETFGAWPPGVPVQVHGMDGDAIFVGDGDLEAARALVSAVEGAELFLYPGPGHLFAESGQPSYDEEAARLLTARVIDFLSGIDRVNARGR
jgi:dienelactone hydrolase